MASRNARIRGLLSNHRKAQRNDTSNIFKVFDESQTREFKEAFNMIDQERAGRISKADLRTVLSSLGATADDDYLDSMIDDARGNVINFTMFLTLFAERLKGTDPGETIRNAFAYFDEQNTGCVKQDRLRSLLTTVGDKLTAQEVDEIFRDAPIDKFGNFDYVEFVRILKYGTNDKEDASNDSSSICDVHI